jgi:hypothetical protein
MYAVSTQMAHKSAVGSTPDAAAEEACKLAVQQLLDDCEGAGVAVGAATATVLLLQISVPQSAQVDMDALRKLFNNLDGIQVLGQMRHVQAAPLSTGISRASMSLLHTSNAGMHAFICAA